MGSYEISLQVLVTINKGELTMENELISFVIDHLKHFKCYPLEFEYKNKIYNYNEIINIIENRKNKKQKEN